MIRSTCRTLIVLFASLLFASVTFADPMVGKLLEDALSARKSGTVAEVTDKLNATAASTDNIDQKSKILFILSDYLFDHREWEKAMQVQYRVLELGSQTSKATAFYNLIWANIELSRTEDAQKAAIELNACPSAAYMRESALIMKKLSPDGIHAKISDVLSSTRSANVPVEKKFNRDFNRLPQTQPWLSPPAAIATASNHAVQSTAVENPQTEVADVKIPSAGKSPGRVLIHAGSWNSALRGDIDSQGMTLGFSDDLSTKSQTSVVIGAEASLSEQDSITVTYVNFSFDGTLNKKMVHRNKTYNPGARFNMRTKFLDLEGFRNFQESSQAKWGFLYGLVIADADLKVVQSCPTGGYKVNSWWSRFGYPYLGLAASSNSSGNIGWDASIKFFSWAGDGRYNTHDLELKLLFGRHAGKKSLNSKFWGYIGYRDFRWDGDFENDSAGVRFAGPVFGLEFLF